MKKRLSKLLDANLRPCFLCMLLFVLVAIPLEPVVAAAEAGVVLILFIFYRNRSRQRRRSMSQYMETITGGTDAVRGSSSMLNTPLPVVVFRADNGEIVWANDGFLGLYTENEDVFSMSISDAVPEFHYEPILDGESAPGEIGRAHV